MNILMIGPTRNGNGGMATVVNNYFNSNLNKSNNLKFIASTIDGNIVKRLIFNIMAFIRVFFYLIINRKIDIVHIHMSHRGSFYRKALYVKLSKMFGKKTIIHLHGSQFDKFYENELNKKKKKYVKKVFNTVDKVIVLSEEWQEKILRWFDCDIEVLHNAVFIPEKINYNNNSKNITLLGRLNERKGTYDLIDVVEKMKSELNKNEYRFILAGDGDLEKLKRMINDKGIEDMVEVLGWIDINKRDKILKDTLIYVLPSYNEGMPMSVLEAMSYGIPTISTNVGGIPKIIDDDINGLLIEPGDKEALYKNIKYLIENNGIRDEMSKNAYITIDNKFGINNNIKRLENIYLSL